MLFCVCSMSLRPRNIANQHCSLGGRGWNSMRRLASTLKQTLMKRIFTGNIFSVHSTTETFVSPVLIVLGWGPWGRYTETNVSVVSPYSPYRKPTVPTTVPMTSLRSLQKTIKTRMTNATVVSLCLCYNSLKRKCMHSTCTTETFVSLVLLVFVVGTVGTP